MAKTLILLAGALAAAGAAMASGPQPRYVPVPAFPGAVSDLQNTVAFESGPMFEPPIDLTQENVSVMGTAPCTIYDTRWANPQIQNREPYRGEVRLVRSVLPPHKRQGYPMGEPNGLPVGSLMEAGRTTPAQLFPGIQQTPWSPPDPTIAVGPNHIVETVNMQISIYTKAGALQFSQNLDNTGNPGFFETVGGGNFCFDPKCYYDNYTGRFVVIALEVYGSTQSFIDIAVSDDSDPNGVWYKYRTNSVFTVGSNTYWVDYPGFGVDNQAFYVCGNLFGLNNSGFGGVGFRVFDKTPLLTGGTAVFRDVRDGNGASAQLAESFGTPIANMAVSVASTSSLRIQAIRNPLTAPTLTTATLTVPAFSTPSGGAPNNGGTIDNLDGRIFNVHWRNGKLYAGHAIRSGSKNVARWYEINTNNWPNAGSPTLSQSGNIDAGTVNGQPVYTFFPAIYSGANGNVGVVVGASSANQFASVRVTGRKPSDPAGTMGALSTLFTGDRAASGRWGDYFGIQVDPADGNTFWCVGQYQNANGWGTWIGSFRVSCPSDFNNDGRTDSDDFFDFLNAYNAGDRRADFNGDGRVDSDDFFDFLNAYNSGC